MDSRTARIVAEVKAWADLTLFQRKTLRISIKKYEGASWDSWPRAGHGMAPFLSSARSLVARGLMHSHKTGVYYPSDKGIALWVEAGRPNKADDEVVPVLVTPEKEAL